MKLIDTHAHLDHEKYDKDREKVIQRNREKLHAVINSGSNPQANQNALKLSEDYSNFIYPALGAHPIHVEEFSEKDLERIEKQIRKNSEEIVAVGEIGLDFHHEKSKDGRDKQKKIFKRFLGVAEELDLPVVTHTRDAEKQAMEIIDDYDLEEVVLHCFNGNTNLAEEAVDRGYWISVSTQVLYSTRVKEIVKVVKTDKILLETDSPFLYPGNERNEPYKVEEALEAIADIKTEDKEKLGKQINQNSEKAYRSEF
ncbi:MAG: TatD family hydrolase [Candidatus Nanohaloarchaeota archaeon QJJ-9]|nr:TatD family hydrolase [Candidatus Nanohaloarchaeota archaeon QJJ-9]